ncbi:hypothetical protein HKD37_08G023397 [Glycine soja]
MTKSLIGHPYAGRLTKDEKIVVVDMTKSMVKPINILLPLKEHNTNSYTTIKQIYNVRHAYCSSIRGSNTEMQQLKMLVDRDQYIHWHRMKDDNVVHDLFRSHPDAIKLTNSCNLIFLIDSTYKTNRDFSLMNAVKTVFPDATNLLCRFHIDKNVKAKCKPLVAQKNAWDYVMEAWGSLVDCPYQGLCEVQVTITEEMEIISKRFEHLDVCGKVHLKTKLQKIAYLDLNSMCPPPEKDSIENIIDVKADSNCGYRTIAALLGLGEESSSLVTMDKWMNITDMRYVIVSRYNVIVVSLSRQRSMTFFPLRSQPPPDSSVHRVISISHVYENHFVQAKHWLIPYIGRMQRYTNLSRLKTKFVDLGEE